MLRHVFHFDNYTCISGATDSCCAYLALFLDRKEVFYKKLDSSEGLFDTVMTANLNNDGVPDFIIICNWEDGSDLSALISKSKTSFTEKQFGDISEIYCTATGDTIQHLQPLLIKDINNDGKDEIIVNLAKYNDLLIANSCTDTIYADR